jgi:hypothetical protein
MRFQSYRTWESSMLRNCRTGQRQPPGLGGAAVPKALSTLVHLCAAALNENPEHDHKKYAANNPNNQLAVHVFPPFISY